MSTGKKYSQFVGRGMSSDKKLDVIVPDAEELGRGFDVPQSIYAAHIQGMTDADKEADARRVREMLAE